MKIGRFNKSVMLCLILMHYVAVIAQRTKAYDYDLHNAFWVGSHLCRFPMPEYGELIADMDNLKAHGFTMIKLQTHWAIDEPLEGKYDFKRYERLIAHAREIGLGVYIGFTIEQAPAWLFERYPETRMVGRNGVSVRYENVYTNPDDGKPGPCFYSPVALQKQTLYINALIKALGKYENIITWNTWQEIANMGSKKIDDQPVDYNPYTLAAYRNWLRRRYRSLDDLNLKWKTNYGAWKYVGPNRERALATPDEIDWKIFMENEYPAHSLRTRYEAIKRADLLKRPVFAHKSYPILGSTQDWTFSRTGDLFGGSSYPAWGSFAGWDDRPDETDTAALRYKSLYAEWMDGTLINTDYLWSASPDGMPVWNAEMQGGPVFVDFKKGRVPDEQDIRRWMLGAVAAGSNGISFWVTRAEIAAHENNGFGLLNSAGTTTPRFEEASRIAKALAKYPELFATYSRPKARVALIISERNFQFVSTIFDLKNHLQFDLRGWHRLLTEQGYDVDFISIDDVSSKTAGIYGAIIFPLPLLVSEEQVARLSDYVSSGGNLISEAAIGRFSEYAYSTRGEMSHAAQKLFGVTSNTFTLVREPKNGKRWSAYERTWGEYLPPVNLTGAGIFSGLQTPANLYLQTFTPGDGAAVVFKVDTAIAATVRNQGKGKAFLFGTFIGHNGTAYSNEGTAKFINALMKDCAVEPDKAGGLVIRKRIVNNKQAWILLNLTNETVTEDVNTRMFKHVVGLLDQDFERTTNGIRIAVPSLDAKILILE